MRELEEHRNTLTTKLSDATKPLPRLHPKLAELYRQKVAKLHDTLNDTALCDQARDQVRSLIDRIILAPVGGELRIDLYGENAGIVSLCADVKKPGRNVWDLAEQ